MAGQIQVSCPIKGHKVVPAAAALSLGYILMVSGSNCQVVLHVPLILHHSLAVRWHAILCQISSGKLIGFGGG
jgi:hypothetical protein